MLIYNSQLKIFTSSIVSADYFLGFSTKKLGNGRNFDNLFHFFDGNKISYKKIIVPEQIHSTNIEIFENDSSKNLLVKVPDTDGLITKKEEMILTVLTADCLPAIFVDEKEKMIGISHQGWRGSIKRMVQKMIDKMIEIGAEKENIKVIFGPAIGDCCYNIDDDRYFQFLEEFDGYSDKIFQFKKGQRFLNLTKLNYLLLLEKGIKKENIDFFPFCTKCDKENFFSFRREKNNLQGEMFNFISLRSGF